MVDAMRYKWIDASSRWLVETSDKRSHRSDVQRLGWIDAHWSGYYLDQITRHVVVSLGDLKRRESSPATANRYLSVVRSVLRRAALDWEWLPRAPRIRLYREPSRRVRWIEPGQARVLLSELPVHQSCAVRFALATGLRHGNVVGLRWSQVDLRRRVCWFEGDQVKGGEAISVSLNDLAMAVLSECRGLNRDFVFAYKGRPIRRLSTRAWYNALERAGIQNFRWHDLRHTWASWLVQEGVPLFALQEMGGWKTGAMVRRYAHLGPAHHLEHARTIDRLLDP